MERVNPRSEAIEAICAQLQQSNERTRWSAVKSLSRIGAGEAIPSLVAQLHRDPDPDVRMEIADALGRLGAQEAVDALIATLRDDPDEDVRIQACRALGQLPSPRAIEALLDCLTGDAFSEMDTWELDDDIDYGATWELQREALEGLENIGDARAVEAVVQFMASDDRDDLEAVGLRVLATVGGERALTFVLHQLREGRPLTRCRAARALACVDEPMIRQPLIDALNDREPDVRVAAGWALAAQPPDAAVPHLAVLLRDPDAAVRLEAVNIVATSQHDAVTAHLIRRLNDPQPEIQLRVIQVLEDRFEQRAIAPMLTLLAVSRRNPVLAAELIKALGVLRASDALVPICQILEDRPTSPVRLQAALALGEIESARLQGADVHGDVHQTILSADMPPDPITYLSALANDEDPQVYRAALISLAELGGSPDVICDPSGDEDQEAAHESAVSDQDGESVEVDYPTSTLEAIAQANRIAESQAAAARQQEMRQFASRIAEGIEQPDVHQEDLQTTADVMSKLHDNDRHVQRAALSALGSMQDQSVIEELRSFLFAHGGALWTETLSTLLELNDTKLLPQLLTVLAQPEQEENHWIAVEALAEILAQKTEVESTSFMS